MKKWLIWLFAVLLLIALVIRIGWQRVNKAKEERRWYLSQLNFRFSGSIDSVTNPRHLAFHLTSGSVNQHREQFLNQNLKYNKVIAFLIYYPDEELQIRIDSAARYSFGDSLCVSSSKNTLHIYRNKVLIHKGDLLPSLHSRPFF